MSQLQKRSGRCMIVISVYGELPLRTYLYRLIFTFAVAELLHLSFTDNRRGGKLGSQLIASEPAPVLDVFTIAKVVLNYTHQIPNF